MKPSLFALLIFICYSTSAQTRPAQTPAPVNQQDLFKPDILINKLPNDVVQFSAVLPPLRQLVGAPKAYYSYFWDFGDGSFNDVNLIDRDKPKHRYSKSGDYQVRLLATNNYASGVSPTAIRTFPIKVNTVAKNTMNTDFFSEKEKALNIKLKVNRNPKPQEDLMAYLGYRNRTGANTSGSIVVFYNDQRFIHKSFGLTDKHTYYGESYTSLDRIAGNSPNPEMGNQHFTEGSNSDKKLSLPRTAVQLESESTAFFDLPRETNLKVLSLKKRYLDYTVLTYNDLQKDDQRFVFMKLQTLPDIIKDTNEVISMTALIIPEDRSLQPEQYELTIQVLASHDPNQMRLVQNRINYRFMKKKKELTYQVDFQNIGKGPARNITLGISLPKQLNGSSLKIDEVSPKLPWCDSIAAKDESCMDTIRTADSIYLVIKNIYLPGLEQNLVKNEDSTKGFIRYTIKFAKKPKKIPFSSRTSIKFDNNKPVETNFATAKFIKGISPAIVAGYNLSLSNGNYSAHGPVQIGYTVAPYSPSRLYFQIEVFAGFLQDEKMITNKVPLPRNVADSFMKTYKPANPFANASLLSATRDTSYTRKRNTAQFVPIHFRYNINNWLSLGLGLSGQIIVSEKVTAVENMNYKILTNWDGTLANVDTTVTKPIVTKSGGGTKTFVESSLAPFFDIQVGRVRQTGPFLGLRYYRQLQGNLPNQFFAYAGFRL